MARAVVVLACALLGAVSALYEDQAGKIDWYRMNVGTPIFADYHTVQARRLILVSTDTAIVASLDADSGDLVWRQVLPEGEAVVSQSLATGGAGLLVGSTTEDGALMVRLWTLGGELVWDMAVPPGDGTSCTSARAVPTAAMDAIALCGSSVSLLRARGGEVKWNWAPADPVAQGVVWRDARETDDGSAVWVAGASATGLVLTSVRVDTGEAATALHVAPSALPLGEAASVILTLDPVSAVAVDTTGQHIVALRAAGDGTLKSARLADVVPGASGRAALLPPHLPGAVALRFGAGHHAVVGVSPDAGAVASLLWEHRSEAPAALGSLRAGSQAIVTHVAPAGSGQLVEHATVLVTPGAAKPMPAPAPVAVPLDAHGEVSAFFLGSYKDEGGVAKQRALLVTSDGAAHGTQEGSTWWTREEGCADPAQVEFVSVRAREMTALREGPEYGQLLRIAGRFVGLSGNAIGGPAAPAAVTTDAFGFQKLVVLRSRRSKVVAFKSEGGALAWTTLPLLQGRPARAVSMAVVTAPTGQPTDLQLVLEETPRPWARSSEGEGGRGAVATLTLDGLTGRPRGAAELLPGRVVWSLALDGGVPVPSGGGAAGTASSTPRAHAFVLDSLEVRLVPDTPEAAALFDHLCRPSAYFQIPDHGAGILRGYGFAAVGGDGSVDKPLRFRAVERWAFVLPPTAQGDFTLTRLDVNEAVHAPVRVLGDRGVLHKYLNHNLLAVAYVQVGRGDPSGADTAAHVTLLDGVSGAVVYDYVQPRTEGPLRIALSENMLVTHARHTQAGAHVVSTVDLFENATEPSVAQMLFSGGDPRDKLPRSSFERRTPFALAASFYLPSEVSAMAVTQTARGITPRHVLFALASGQLLALDKRIIDPRRPKKTPTAADKEEGLAQYHSALGPPPPTSLVTHGQSVARARGIKCAATTLESTTVVALYGCDLFVTRYSPAKTFDKLGESFNHVALIGAVGGLTVLTIITTIVRRRQEVNRLWR